MNIVVTGGTGYLGSYLVKELCKLNHVTVIKRSYDNIERLKAVESNISFFNTDIDNWNILFKEKKDLIIHTATLYGRHGESAIDVVDSNLNFPLKLLEYSIANKIKYFINIDTVLNPTTNFYSLSKSQFLEWLKFFSKNILVINLKLEHFFGPGDAPHKFITYVINEMVTGKNEIKLTSGGQERDFIYIDDVIDGIKKIVKNIDKFDEEFYEFHICSENKISIKKLVEFIKEQMQSNICLNFGAILDRKNDTENKSYDNKKLISLGWEPKTDLKEGLIRTIEYEKNRNKIN